MAEEKKQKQTYKVGETIEVKEGAELTRPNGERHTISGGAYVLDEAGSYVVDGEEVTVK